MKPLCTFTGFSRARQGCAAAWVLVLLAFAAGNAQAGTFRINQDCAAIGCIAGDLPGFPIQITESGHYRLVSDLVLEANEPFAFLVQAPGGAVTIDLGGYTIRGPQTCAGGTPAMGGGAPVTSCTFEGLNGGAIRVQAVSELVIRNGTIRGVSSQGISLNAGKLVLIEDMLITENASGITVSRGAASADSLLRVRRVSLNRNLSYGLQAIGDDAGLIVIENSQVFGNGFRGLSINALGAAVVREVQIGRSGQHGMVGGGNKRCYSTSYFANNNGAAQVLGCEGRFNRCVGGSC